MASLSGDCGCVVKVHRNNTRPAMQCKCNAMHCRTKALGSLWRNEPPVLRFFPISTNLASVFGSSHRLQVHLVAITSNRSVKAGRSDGFSGFREIQGSQVMPPGLCAPELGGRTHHRKSIKTR
ncbi:hypothetical protein NXS19_010552 [Fusarium pseudograminearum]|nr:hypothetical protein NXS19_010552 [Fusarium pseudograminearum]